MAGIDRRTVLRHGVAFDAVRMLDSAELHRLVPDAQADAAFAPKLEEARVETICA